MVEFTVAEKKKERGKSSLAYINEKMQKPRSSGGRERKNAKYFRCFFFLLSSLLLLSCVVSLTFTDVFSLTFFVLVKNHSVPYFYFTDAGTRQSFSSFVYYAKA